jgi:hypothetical protein
MKYFLAMWCDEGFETVQDITANHPENWEKSKLFDMVKKGIELEVNPLAQQVAAMRLRAQFNSQRHYEIYIMSSDDSVDVTDVAEWGNSDPQGLVDWVRVNHYAKIYDDRANPSRRVIV